MCVQAGGRDLRSEPVCFRQTDCEGDEVIFDLRLRELFTDLVEAFHGLEMSVQSNTTPYMYRPCLEPEVPLLLQDSPRVKGAHVHTRARQRIRQNCLALRSKPSKLRPHLRRILYMT